MILMQTRKLINLHKLNNKLINTSYNQKVLKLQCVKNSNSLYSHGLWNHSKEPAISSLWHICDWQRKLLQNKIFEILKYLGTNS